MSHKPDKLASTRWALIRRLRDWDDQEGWREFFRIYWKLIYGVALKSGLTPSEAEEAVQETVISVCKSIKAFEADPRRGSFKSWLLKLTRWRIKDQYRKRHSKPDHWLSQKPSSSSLGPGGQALLAEDGIPDPGGNILERIWDEEWENNLVETALETMKKQVSSKQFQIFFMHAIKKTPAQDVARVLGISVNQVYINKHRLGGLLKDEIRKLDDGLL